MNWKYIIEQFFYFPIKFIIFFEKSLDWSNNTVTKFESQNKAGYQAILALCLFGFIFFGYIYFIATRFNEWSQRGLFGDSFGGLNVIFSGFAFIAALITLLSTLRHNKEERKNALEDRKDSEISTKISALQSYIQSASSSETEKKGVAKLILHNLTESIFYSNEYNDLMSPNLNFIKVEYQNHQETKALEIKYQFINNHPSSFFLNVLDTNFKCRLLQFINKENGYIINTVSKDLSSAAKIEPEKNYILIISGLEARITETLYITLILQGCVVDKIWKQTIVIQPEGIDLTSTVISPVLIK